MDSEYATTENFGYFLFSFFQVSRIEHQVAFIVDDWTVDWID